MGITIEQVETIAARLRTLPPIENKKQVVSKQESIRMLTSEIAALRERGYTLDQVAELLTANQLEIGAPTLKSYLQRSQSVSRKANGKRKNKTLSAPLSSDLQPKSVVESKPATHSIGERAAALAQSQGNTTSAATAITRPDRSRI